MDEDCEKKKHAMEDSNFGASGTWMNAGCLLDRKSNGHCGKSECATHLKGLPLCNSES